MTWFADLAVALPLAALCVLVSAFCSGSEVALFSLRRIDREQLGRATSATDLRIAKMLERPRRLIATVLIGNEVFNSLLAVLALGVVQYRVCPVNTSPWAVGGIALAITLPLVVLIAEVTSKTLAAKAPLTWARLCAWPLTIFAIAMTPIRLVIGLVSEIVLRPFGGVARAKPEHDLSEEEFRKLVDAGSAQGQVDARERRLIHRVFEFSDKNVGQVMTPRERIFALSYDLPTQRVVKEIAARGFSRVPIYQKSLDNIRGILNAKNLMRTAAGQSLGRPLGDVLHEPLFVPRTTPVKRLFLTFKQKKVHMALVVSEYGKVLGLVTMDDVLAQIFGVLRDERADLQASMPPGRKVVRTPLAGVPTATPPKEDQSVPVPREEILAKDDSGPAVREEITRPGSEVSGLNEAPTPPRRETEPELESRRIGKRADSEEVTPPAVDIADLRRGGRT